MNNLVYGFCVAFGGVRGLGLAFTIHIYLKSTSLR